ncbi:hypothetical protein CAPTEDRAFT_130250 [Capitella teleta]|uniref:phosphoinositide 5-phosphatase n=1 Tax=Capitella teleta TaxID=283909 RepID=R7TVC1_CAPTE|nr:hypothetical protein CAPTEDRAFT_130250 [Capitella teleta]|eukprot:ELT95411.1 hypothetical protein CAPTEDRAFT_130250 [Capitella teleta]
MESSRDNHIKLQMRERESDYTNLQPYRIFCGTWNVNGQQASEAINEWLCPAEDSEPPDIYAIGFQELDLSKNAYIFSESVREEDWYKRIKEALHPKAKYKKVVKLVRLVGMMLVVFIRKGLELEIYDVMSGTVGTGIMGVMGNKGGVAVRFGLRDSTLCFVNSHLAAHTVEFERPHTDFKDINSRMLFGNRTISDHELVPCFFFFFSSENSLLFCSIVIWLGDLNYRLSDIDNDACKKLISDGRLQELMKYDQLVRQISQKNVFLDYLEGKISFIPTYKYDPGTDTWDTSEKCRTPAWCDRILWRGSNVGQLCYRSHMACKLSDHKPVSSIFESGIKVIDRAKQRQVYEDVMKQLDKWENEFLPQVEVSTMEIKFKDIKFIEQKKEILVVSNTGQVPVQFEFIPKPSDTNFCEPWLSVEPSKAVISVGAKCEVHLSVYVNKDTGPSLNSGKARIEDILVLHLDGGKDLFITVSGNYIPSSFSSSIETLVRMFKPVTDVETGSLIEIVSASTSLQHLILTIDQASSPNPSEDPPLDIPKEIWRLVDHLYKYGMEQDELFRQPGLHSEIQLIRDCLDQGKPRLLPGSVHSVAEALLLFLEVLPEPVVPYEHYDLCLHVCDNFTQAKQVLQRLPTSHRNVFKYICAFLRELLKHSASNFLDARFLGELHLNGHQSSRTAHQTRADHRSSLLCDAF